MSSHKFGGLKYTLIFGFLAIFWHSRGLAETMIWGGHMWTWACTSVGDKNHPDAKNCGWYDTGTIGSSGGGSGTSGSNGGPPGGGHYINNNSNTTTDNDKDRIKNCQDLGGHKPIEVSTGSETLTVPLFSLPGEMGLNYSLHYVSPTGWSDNLGYWLDTSCGNYSDNPPPCYQVIFHRPDGSSIVFTGNTQSVGNFPEQGGGNLATLTHNSDYTWTLHDEDATTQVYSGNGLAGAVLQSIKDASGVGWTIAYDTMGRPSRVTHTSGAYYTIARQGTTQNGVTTVQATVTDPAGNVYQFSYSSIVPIGLKHTAFQLNSLTLPGSPATAITYKYQYPLSATAPIDLTEVDYNGAPYFKVTYGSPAVNATGTYLADGSEAYSIVYTYPSAGKMTAAVTNPLGHTTTKQYNSSYGGQYLLTSVSDPAVSDCGATVNSIAYDSNGYVQQTVDNNNITHRYTYATNGQLQNETEGYNTATPRTTTYVWDPNQQLNRLTSVTVKGTLNYNKTVYGYNAQNRLASVAVTNQTANGTANQTLTTSYTYTLYSNGMVKQMVVTAPSPNSTDKVTTNYDTLGNVTSVTQVNGATTIATTYSNYNGLGEPQKIVGPNGDETDYTYDARGRVSTKTTHPYGVAATWTYTYDGFGLLKQISAPDGEVTTWNRDAEMRVTTITHNDKDGTSTETLGYDDNNDVTTDTITRGSDTGYKSTIVYDGLGRVYQRKGNHGQVLTYAYDGNGNVLSVTDALGHKTSYTYDALNRVSTMTDAKSGLTQYFYDVGDHRTKVIDPRGLTTTYTWDGLGLLWKQVSPDTGTTSFGYDSYGRLATKTRADSLQTTYAYDSLNRLTSKSSNGNTRTYTWDTCTNGKGRLCSAINQGFNTVSYSYTPEGWVAGRSFVITSGPTYSLGYSYNNMGQLAVVNYPDGNQALYDYTHGAVADVRLKVGGNIVTGVTGIAYRPMDLAMSTWTAYNGLVNTISYDNDLRPSSIAVPGIQSLAFSYDNADRITKITNGFDTAMTQTLGYDELDRLKTVSSSADNESFNYDADGNRTSGVVNGASTTYTIPSTSNRLSSVSGGMSATYGYDAQGNLTTLNGSTAYTYGPFGELASAGGMSYKHGADGQRLLKSGTPGTSYFAPDVTGTLLAETNATGWRDYVWLNGRLVAMIGSGNVFDLHDDQTGRPQVMTQGASHTVDWAARNFAFDRTVTFNILGGDFNIGFPGQYHDSESDLWQNGYRDYNASLGRYIESDPIGLLGGINTYCCADWNGFVEARRGTRKTRSMVENSWCNQLPEEPKDNRRFGCSCNRVRSTRAGVARRIPPERVRLRTCSLYPRIRLNTFVGGKLATSMGLGLSSAKGVSGLLDQSAEAALAVQAACNAGN